MSSVGVSIFRIKEDDLIINFETPELIMKYIFNMSVQNSRKFKLLKLELLNTFDASTPSVTTDEIKIKNDDNNPSSTNNEEDEYKFYYKKMEDIIMFYKNFEKPGVVVEWNNMNDLRQVDKKFLERRTSQPSFAYIYKHEYYEEIDAEITDKDGKVRNYKPEELTNAYFLITSGRFSSHVKTENVFNDFGVKAFLNIISHIKTLSDDSGIKHNISGIEIYNIYTKIKDRKIPAKTIEELREFGNNNLSSRLYSVHASFHGSTSKELSMVYPILKRRATFSFNEYIQTRVDVENFSEIKRMVKNLNNAYLEKDYLKEFSWYDFYKEISSDELKKNILDKINNGELRCDPYFSIPPDISSRFITEHLEKIILKENGKATDIDVLLDGKGIKLNIELSNFLNQNIIGIISGIKKMSIFFKTSDKNLIKTKKSHDIMEFLNIDIIHTIDSEQDIAYHIMNSNWVEISSLFRNRVESEFSRIVEEGEYNWAKLGGIAVNTFPNYYIGSKDDKDNRFTNEAIFNAKTALNTENTLILDAINLSPVGFVEFCDIFNYEIGDHPREKGKKIFKKINIIHVKRGTDAQGYNHIGGQLSTSWKIFENFEKMRKTLRIKMEEENFMARTNINFLKKSRVSNDYYGCLKCVDELSIKSNIDKFINKDKDVMFLKEATEVNVCVLMMKESKSDISIMSKNAIVDLKINANNYFDNNLRNVIYKEISLLGEEKISMNGDEVIICDKHLSK